MYLDGSKRVDEVGSIPAASGGGFLFDLPGVQAAIIEWARLEDELLEDAKIAQSLVGVAGPGQEPASANMASSVTSSGEAYLSHNRQMQEIVRGYITNLINARNEYVARDEAGRDTFLGGQ